MNIFVAQCNPDVGDLKGNLAMVQQEIAFALQQDTDIIVFPELVLLGYPPRDLLYKDEIWASHDRAMTQIAKTVKQLTRPFTVIMGGIHQVTLTHGQYARYNAGFVIDNYSPRVRIIHKRLLPCYDVFDETRYFCPAETYEPYRPITIKTSSTEVDIDLLVCEDIWNYNNSCDRPWLPASYHIDPVSQLRGSGPIFVINGSPFWEGKVRTCLKLVESICAQTERPVIYCNQVGAHDDIVTHGASMISIPPSNMDCRVYTRIGNMFATDRMVVRLSDQKTNHHMLFPDQAPGEQGPFGLHMPEWYGNRIREDHFDAWCDFQALRLCIVDYCRRTGFKEVVLGLSGGIDSALVATIAVAALGSQNVHGVTMPSKFSSEGSWKDAEALANNLKLGSFQHIPIEDIVNQFRASLLSGAKQKFNHPVTDENLQSRVRGAILMGLSNDNGWLLLTTGNKSELAVGYCTLYGDMCGGLAVLSDIPKTRVFQMARCINEYAGQELIPVSTIEKPPSAELSPGQLDTDSLPPYEDLDPLLEMIYADVAIDEMVKRSSIPSRVHEIVRKVDMNEYKRHQMPLGPKVRERSFGSGRRMPIAAKVNLVKESAVIPTRR